MGRGIWEEGAGKGQLTQKRSKFSFGDYAALLALAACLPLAACTTYRVEYHRRPSYYSAASLGELPKSITLEDGTVVVYNERPVASGPKREAKGEPAQIRAEQEDGTVILRAFAPRDVLSNTLSCLKNHEYELLWDQILSAQTKRAYEERGQGAEEFTAFLQEHRLELAATLTRLLLGTQRQEVVMENVGSGVIRFSFHPHVASQFQFKTVEVVSEPEGLRLLMIR